MIIQNIPYKKIGTALENQKMITIHFLNIMFTYLTIEGGKDVYYQMSGVNFQTNRIKK